jgi:putative membrane protein
MRRFPQWVFNSGKEPDPRFTLANERTFLAWTRTSLALIAGGVALEAIELPIHPGFRLAASLLVLVLGLVVPLVAWVEWGRTERAMRQERPLPGSLPVLVLMVGVVVVGALVLIGILLR